MDCCATGAAEWTQHTAQRANVVVVRGAVFAAVVEMRKVIVEVVRRMRTKTLFVGMDWEVVQNVQKLVVEQWEDQEVSAAGTIVSDLCGHNAAAKSGLQPDCRFVVRTACQMIVGAPTLVLRSSSTATTAIFAAAAAACTGVASLQVWSREGSAVGCSAVLACKILTREEFAYPSAVVQILPEMQSSLSSPAGSSPAGRTDVAAVG